MQYEKGRYSFVKCKKLIFIYIFIYSQYPLALKSPLEEEKLFNTFFKTIFEEKKKWMNFWGASMEEKMYQILDWSKCFLHKLNFCDNILAITIFVKQSLTYLICDYESEWLLHKNYFGHYIFTKVQLAENFFGLT